MRQKTVKTSGKIILKSIIEFSNVATRSVIKKFLETLKTCENSALKTLAMWKNLKEVSELQRKLHPNNHV